LWTAALDSEGLYWRSSYRWRGDWDINSNWGNTCDSLRLHFFLQIISGRHLHYSFLWHWLFCLLSLGIHNNFLALYWRHLPFSVLVPSLPPGTSIRCLQGRGGTADNSGRVEVVACIAACCVAGLAGSW
jgi:hypothetical protein